MHKQANRAVVAALSLALTLTPVPAQALAEVVDEAAGAGAITSHNVPQSDAVAVQEAAPLPEDALNDDANVTIQAGGEATEGWNAYDTIEWRVSEGELVIRPAGMPSARSRRTGGETKTSRISRGQRTSR